MVAGLIFGDWLVPSTPVFKTPPGREVNAEGREAPLEEESGAR